MMISNTSNNHRQLFSRSSLLYLGFLIVFITACALQETVQPTPIVVVVTATSPASTETPVPSATSPVSSTFTPISASPTPSGPTCNVLQDLNLRNGPGTAYNPPITALKAGTEFVPIGYDPQGVPGGPWVQARVDSISQTGWVSAGAQFVSCTIAFDSLPLVEAPPPPKGPPPRVGSGAVDGSNIDSFRFSIDYNPDYFVRMAVFRSDDGNEVFRANKDGRGIASVEFLVTSPDDSSEFVEYYRRTEVNPGYCIFAGGEPNCNPWTFENNQYKWNPGGRVVESGSYKLTVTVTAQDGEVGVWLIDIDINLQ
jgi:hypothetical protein